MQFGAAKMGLALPEEQSGCQDKNPVLGEKMGENAQSVRIFAHPCGEKRIAARIGSSPMRAATFDARTVKPNGAAGYFSSDASSRSSAGWMIPAAFSPAAKLFSLPS